jgi:flagellar hook protein FlgE
MEAARMSLFASLSNGVSGLTNQSVAMRVISDNIANSTTFGYKAHRTLFSPLVTASRDFSGVATSSGVTSSIQRLQSVQGATVSTQSATDIALSGAGFLVVADIAQQGPDRQLFYTRSDGFVLNKEGFLVSPKGSFLQGWRTNPDGNILPTQAIESVQITNRLSARASSQVHLGANLKAGEALFDYDTSQTLDDNMLVIAQNSDRAAYSISTTLFDSEGQPHEINMSFLKRSQNLWDFLISTDGSNVVGGQIGTATLLHSGSIYFNPNGSLKYATQESFQVAWSGGVEVANISLNLGDHTGGSVFNQATATGALSFQDGVVAVTIDDGHPSAPNPILGTYTFETVGVDQIRIIEPNGLTVYTATVPALPTQRSIQFENGLTITLDDTWIHPGISTLGTMDVQLIQPKATGSGSNGVVQFSSNYNPYSLSQNGFASGTLNDIQITSEGTINGFFTNGETRSLWKLPIAVFNAPQYLDMTPDGRYRQTAESGDPFYKVAGDGTAAKIVSYALEQSTVDIATEFTSMIVTQRAYQASSKAITTVDQMLAELMSIR